jgi:hypothetical protein
MDTAMSYTTKGPRNDGQDAAAKGSTRRYKNLSTDQHEDLDPSAEETRLRVERGEIAEAPDNR